MRGEPSLTSNNLQVSDDATAATDLSAIAVNANTGSSQLGVVDATVSSGLTQYRPYALRGSNNTASYVAFSAEL